VLEKQKALRDPTTTPKKQVCSIFNLMTHTVAIAGCSGYIGTHMTRAALNSGMQVYGIDPALDEGFKNHDRFHEVQTVEQFCATDADCFYLALQPNHRDPYLNRLIANGKMILSEKPMARAREPEICDTIVETLAQSNATMRYNFLYLYNPITYHIIKFLDSHPEVTITSIKALVEKNRESRRNDRNLKFMEPIQYQETIHSLALMLVLRGELMHYHGSDFDATFPGGLIAVGDSFLYNVPSSDYDAIPDGRFHGSLTASGFRMDIITNFKRLDHKGLPTRPQKRITISGRTKDMPFVIEADYQRDHEMLEINGETVPLPDFDPYTLVWYDILTPDNQTPFYVPPDEHLARTAYRLSALLWKTSYIGEELVIDSDKTLARASLSYPNALESGRLPQYRSRPTREWVEKHLIDPVIDVTEGLRTRNSHK
jgi:hypothetical protein